MAATEDDILRDEQERNNLLKVIADVETAMAVSTPGTRRVLENTVENARKRIATLDRRIDEAKVEHAAEVQTQIAVAAALAAKETKLSAKEREAYRGFMEEAYFTRKDLGRLDEFYTHSYDRLSEGGKEEMSQRLHEGIKRGEISYSDLSHAIRERDDAHCAAKAGKTPPSKIHDNPNEAEGMRTPSPNATTMDKIDLAAVDLKDIKLADGPDSPSAPDVPSAANAKPIQR